MFSTAARAAPEWTIPGIPLWGESVTLRILPPPPGMNAFVAAACDISQVPVTFSSITVRKPFGEIASAGERNWPPALLTRTSRRPWRSSSPSKNASTGVLLADVEHLVPERPRQPRGERRRLGQRLRPPPAADHGRAQAHQLERRLPPEAGPRPGDDARPSPRADRPETPAIPANASFQPSRASLQSRSAGVLWDRHVRPRPTAGPRRATCRRLRRRPGRRRTADRGTRRLPPRGDGRPRRQLQDAAHRPRDLELQAGRRRSPSPPS